MKHLESFGSVTYYRKLIILTNRNDEFWRKVAHILNKTRRDLRSWDVVDKETQKKEAEKYVQQAIRDTKLPDQIKDALKEGMTMEFGFNF